MSKPNVTRVQSATQWTASVHTWHMSKPNVTRVQSATQWTASVHTWHMSKPNVTRVQSATQWTASWVPRWLLKITRRKWILAWRHMALPTCSVAMRTMYGMRLESFANDVKKKRATFAAVQKMAVSLWENVDFLSKSCVFQHFSFHLFFCIRWKYCKGYKIKNCSSKKNLKKRGAAPAPVTLLKS